MDLVYTGDTNNFHIFQVVDKKAVGSLYLDKKEDIPEGVDMDLITPNRDNFLWNKRIDSLIDKARDGSKAKAKLLKTKKEYTE